MNTQKSNIKSLRIARKNLFVYVQYLPELL